MSDTPHHAADDPEPQFGNRPVEDWAHMVKFDPALYLEPKTLDEVRAFLEATLRDGGKTRVRVLGGLHSCADIVVSDAVIDVRALPRTLEWDAGDGAVVASANWRLRDFLLELSTRHRSLSATGGTDEQTLAGLISTDTAPATPRHEIYELLDWVEVLTVSDDGASIVEKRISRGEPAFGAAVASLGAIGFVTRVRFRVIEEPFFETVQKIEKLDDMLGDLDATSARYDFWRIDWIPETEHGLIWTARRIPRDQADPDGDYKPDHAESVLKWIFKVLHAIDNPGPFFDGALKWVYTALAAFYGTVKATGPLRNMLPVDRTAPLRVAMAEWSFEPARVNDVVRECRAYFDVARWPNLPIEIELTKTDDFMMSPWNWEGLPYIVKFNFMYLTDFLSDGEKQEVYAHLRGLWEHFTAKGIRFKAHWGKINFMDPAFVREHYHPDEFHPHVRRLFLNDYVAQRLGADS